MRQACNAHCKRRQQIGDVMSRCLPIDSGIDGQNNLGDLILRHTSGETFQIEIVGGRRHPGATKSRRAHVARREGGRRAPAPKDQRQFRRQSAIWGPAVRRDRWCRGRTNRHCRIDRRRQYARAQPASPRRAGPSNCSRLRIKWSAARRAERGPRPADAPAIGSGGSISGPAIRSAISEWQLETGRQRQPAVRLCMRSSITRSPFLRASSCAATIRSSSMSLSSGFNSEGSSERRFI